MTSKEFFKNKKIAVVGLGPHMEMIPDVKYLIRLGAVVILYDMRSNALMHHALAELVEAGLVGYSVGHTGEAVAMTGSASIGTAIDLNATHEVPHRTTIADDIAASDIVLLSPDISPEASFLEKARTLRVPIEYAQTLFLKLAPPITLIGILGTCGKSTVADIIYTILKKEFADASREGTVEQEVFSIDPDAENALSYLRRIKKGDIVLARIPAAMVGAYADARISPHIAVFTVVPPRHTSLFNILEFQTYNNFIIGNDTVIDQIREDMNAKPKSKMLRTGTTIVPADWNIVYRGAHDKENIALALRIAELFKVSPDTSRQVLEEWKGIRGRLEFVKKVAGIEFYNDTASTGPIATLTAIRALSQNKNVVLIMGGASGISSTLSPIGELQDYNELIDSLSQYISSIILLPGSGTMRIRGDIAEIKDLPCYFSQSVLDAVEIAREHAGKGDRVIFSPGFEARGYDKTRKARGDTFVKAVRGL